MPERVYSVDKSEHAELKKLLEYDPYFDPNIIPTAPKEDKPKDKMTKEELETEEERQRKVSEGLKSINKNQIFSRQECDLREGASVGLDENKSYLYVSASDDFFEEADKLLKTKFKTISRATSEEEKRVIEIINEEKSRANAGFGMMFG